jgi:hypothetical protein
MLGNLHLRNLRDLHKSVFEATLEVDMMSRHSNLQLSQVNVLMKMTTMMLRMSMMVEYFLMLLANLILKFQD